MLYLGVYMSLSVYTIDLSLAVYLLPYIYIYMSLSVYTVDLIA